MLYTARVLADSLHPDYRGIDRQNVPRISTRLTTVEVTIPRFILAEFNTHRRISRNSASSRAIPTEKLIANVKREPFVPLKFNKRVKGMGVGAELRKQAAKISKDSWMWACEQAIKAAEILLEQDVDKSRANRLLEPFMPHTVIASGTEWDNFFALRNHPNAQPEFDLCARVMLKAMLESEPVEVQHDQWHLPLVTQDEMEDTQMDYGPTEFLREMVESEAKTAGIELYWPMISASRCARVSYDTHENFETVAKSMERAKTLVTNGHLSPLEHVARPINNTGTNPDFNLPISNFDGWVQLRKLVPMEANRVGFLENRMSWEEMEIPEIPELEEMATA